MASRCSRPGPACTAAGARPPGGSGQARHLAGLAPCMTGLWTHQDPEVQQLCDYFVAAAVQASTCWTSQSLLCCQRCCCSFWRGPPSRCGCCQHWRRCRCTSKQLLIDVLLTLQINSQKQLVNCAGAASWVATTGEADLLAARRSCQSRRQRPGDSTQCCGTVLLGQRNQQNAHSRRVYI